MSLFKVFPKSHIDEEILNLYLEIEVLISKIAEKFEDYLRYVFESEYYKRNPKDKKFYSIIRVYHFFKKIKEDFSDCFTIRENKKYFDFQKNSGTFAEKKEIETELKVLIRLLNRIHSYVLKLDKKNIKSNDFRELEKFIDEFKRREEFLKVIQKHDEERIKKLLHKIVKEAKENQKKGIWLLDQNNKRNKTNCCSRIIFPSQS